MSQLCRPDRSQHLGRARSRPRAARGALSAATLLVLVLAALIGVHAERSASAVPPNLVTNGGFETGTFTGWTGSAAAAVLCGAGIQHSGICAAKVFEGPLGQTVTTVAGGSYALDFWITNPGSNFSVSWNGTVIVPLTVAGTYLSYTHIIVPLLLAAGASSTLEFDTSGGPPGLLLDDVNLVLNLPPSITKAFGAATIPLSGSTSLTLTLTNPNSTAALSGVAVSDTLPAGLVISTPNGSVGTTCSGTITNTQATNLISLSGGSLSASGSCVIVVNVTGITAGAWANTTAAITSTNGGTGAVSNTANLQVVAPGTVVKSFSPSLILPAGNSNLTLVLTNSNTVALTGVGIADNWAATATGVTATGVTVTNSCGGTSA